ncbi:MAG: transglutaminase family protein [Rhodospirillales bacterium]
MKFSIGCSLAYRLAAPVPFVFNIEVARSGAQTILDERLELTPASSVERWTMPESGNRYFRVHGKPGRLHVHYTAEVELIPHVDDPRGIAEVTAGALPFDVLTHLYPSRYCQSDKLKRFAARTFGDLPLGYQRVNGICNWIRDNVDYVLGSSDALTSAFDTVTERAGVCRDFAHLGIALCRALGIPARYVSAYAWRLDPPDFHAVFEAFLVGPSGTGWYLFDPTRMSAPDGLVRIGIGRDAAEVAFCSPYGDVDYEPPEVWINTPEADPTEDITTDAVKASI